MVCLTGVFFMLLFGVHAIAACCLLVVCWMQPQLPVKASPSAFCKVYKTGEISLLSGMCWTAAQHALTSQWRWCGLAAGAGGAAGEEPGCFMLISLPSVRHGDGCRLFVPRNSFSRVCIYTTFLLGIGKLRSMWCRLLCGQSSRTVFRAAVTQHVFN